MIKNVLHSLRVCGILKKIEPLQKTYGHAYRSHFILQMACATLFLNVFTNCSIDCLAKFQ